MISYAGVPLVVPDPDLVERIERWLDVRGITETAPVEWTGTPGSTWKAPEFVGKRPIELGRLHWPRMASKWATGHFLATEYQLDQIRSKAYTKDSRGVISAELVLQSADPDSDNSRTLKTQMFLLPPRPLFQFEDDFTSTFGGTPGTGTGQGGGAGTGQTPQQAAPKNLYLLTLVDDRYWWWNRSGTFDLSNGSTWAQLYAAIGNLLQVTISVDPVPGAYQQPPLDLQNHYDYLPLLLDAVAYSVQQRIVRGFDGTVTAQNVDNAKSYANNNWAGAAPRLHAGGLFNLDPTQTHCDASALVPDTVRMVVSTYPSSLMGSDDDPSDPCNVACRPTQTKYDQQLFRLGLTEYKNTLVRRGTKLFHSSVIGWTQQSSSGSSGSSGNDSILNDSDLTALANQLAKDWYKWQRGDLNACFAGVVSWIPEGMSSWIEISAYPKRGSKSSDTEPMVTVVCREQMNDLSTEVYHRWARSSGSSSSGSSSSGSSSSTSASSSTSTSSSESSSQSSSESSGCVDMPYVESVNWDSGSCNLSVVNKTAQFCNGLYMGSS